MKEQFVGGVLWPPHLEKMEVGLKRSIDIKQWEKEYLCQPEMETPVIKEESDRYGKSPLINAFEQWLLNRKSRIFLLNSYKVKG